MDMESPKLTFPRTMDDLVNIDSINDSKPISEVFSLSTRVFLILFNVIIIILGLLGNGFVLWASTKCRAIPINKVSLVLLENLAFCDMLITLFIYTPMLVTLSADGWVLDRIPCFFTAFIGDVPLALEGFIIAGISCHKLFILTHCLQPSRCTRKQMINALILFWVLATVIFLLFSFYMADGMAIYVPYAMSCVEITDSFISFIIGNVIVVAVPLLLIIVSNVWTLIIVIKRTHQNTGKFLPNSSAITTVSLICWTYIFSYLPVFVVPLVDDMSMVTVSSLALSANVIANPFIYTMSYNSFRKVVVECLLQITGCRRKKLTSVSTNQEVRTRPSRPMKTTNDLYSTAL